MTTQQEMAGLFEQWWKLTQAEAGAIQHAAWPALRDIQKTKAALQCLLSEVKKRWIAENPGRTWSRPEDHPFFQVICRLLSMEARNEEMLAARLRKSQAQKKSLDEAARNLRNIRQTYALKPAAVWNRYS